MVIVVSRLCNTFFTANDNVPSTAEIAGGIVGRTYVGVGLIVVTERSSLRCRGIFALFNDANCVQTSFRVCEIFLLVNNPNFIKSGVTSFRCAVRPIERWSAILWVDDATAVRQLCFHLD